MEPEPENGRSNRVPGSPSPGAARARPTFFRFAVGLLAAIDWRWVWLPPVLFGVELGLTYFWFLENVSQGKVLLETTSLVVLWGVVLLGLWRAVRTRAPFWLWLSLVMAALLFREYHLLKASTSIVYATLVVLWLVAWRAYPTFAEYLQNRRFMTALMLMSLSYVITQTLDIDTFKKGHGVFGATEELMELSGHGFALLAVLVAGPIALGKSGEAPGRGKLAYSVPTPESGTSSQARRSSS